MAWGAKAKSRITRVRVWLVRVLDGAPSHYGWGALPLGVGMTLWAYSYVPRATPAAPYPPEPEWRIPLMCVGLFLALVGLFLLFAPNVRNLIVSRRNAHAVESKGLPGDLTPAEVPTADDFAEIQKFHDNETARRLRTIKNLADWARYFNQRDQQDDD